MITIVLPTRNEAEIIRANLERLLAFLRIEANCASPVQHSMLDNFRIFVADNASTDATRAIVREIAAQEPRVELLEIPEAGKGGAVLRAWEREGLGIRDQGSGRTHHSSLIPHTFVFMDADLATDLRHLPELIAAIRSGADIAIGSRNLPGSRSEREIGRRAISWCYRVLLRLLFGLRVSDPPCGFKAVNERVVREIVPQICDRQWFFDTELLIRAQRAGLRITEIPIAWHEPRRGSSIRKVLRIITSDLRAMWRLRRELRSTISPPLTEGE